MIEGCPKVADPLGCVDAEPAEVVARLRHRLLPVRSVWFPTRRELRDWDAAGVPLYVRSLGPDRIEVGPRLQSMWASCFAPVWAGHAWPEGRGTRMGWIRRWPRFTLALLIGWWSILGLWLVALQQPPVAEDPQRWMVFWTFLALASTAGPALGRRWGGQALDAAEPWLRDAMIHSTEGEDW